MTPSEIHKALAEIRATFPKSSKMFVGFIERADKTDVFEDVDWSFRSTTKTSNPALPLP